MARRHPDKSALDLQAFAPSTLADSEGLTAALRTLESCLAGPDIPLDLIVQDLCAIPNLFEFIVSALPSAEGLVHRILDAYPTDPALVDASSASSLLRRLSSVIFALPPDLFSTDTIRRRIEQHKVYVEDAMPVLTLSCSTDFSRFSMGNKKQKRKNNNITPTIDTTPFRKLRAKVPSNNAEASQISRKISGDLKMILKFYLELLLEPFLAQHLRDAYVSTGGAMTVHLTSPQATKVIEDVNPMQAALYFENADSFGGWRIIIGTGATKKLRELANGDRKKCVIVMKKIKQLSKGYFSDENQKRLNGSSSSAIPIFEAKIQQDLRLVYQVDVVPDHDGEVDRQVIKIYGIYTHTQLNCIWDAMGQRLAGKGKEYCRRCVVRNRPVNSSGDIYLPAHFPPESLQNDAKPASLVLSGEDMRKLHFLLVLEKYVTLSQAFLQSLIVNQDVQHVFELTPQELKIVECKTSCYVLGRSGTGKTTTMLFKIQRAWELQKSGVPKPRQIFVTKSRVLATKVQEYFAELLESLILAGYSLEELKRMQARNTESGLMDANDEDQTDLPQRYSALEEIHFPLFVTFDKLARMIAADVLGGDDPEARRFAKIFIDTHEAQAQDSFVTYDVFARTYWPHFSQLLTKGLEPWLVFSEFMGVIKGSERSLSYPDGFLDNKAYRSLSARSNPTFAKQRRALYAIFEAYCKLKNERRHHDVADRTHAILKTLKRGTPLRGRKVDYLYVDEAQDNLLIDALLLRLLCRNPDGLFWAGDTAQTISAGSSFRFDDLKAFLYRIEQNQSTHLIQDRSVIEPTAFQLVINYRSHGGILNCAHTVIERITRFWPEAIDGLQPEEGIVDGLKPVFFRGWDQDTVRYEQFLFGASGSRIEFGARQCILVRDDEAIEKLRKEVGDIGLIMTLYDSKGLEFDDVLLYNFFEDSAVDISRWRVLLNHAEGEVDGQDLAHALAPSFKRDEGRFARVCSELKMLYVGITRARKNLWIFDKSDKSEPMRMIWTSRNQVQNCTPEWESSGQTLFKHQRYFQAKHCFARASLPRMVAICEAFRLREVARARIGVAPQKDQQEAFLTAADAFMVSGNNAPQGKDKLQYYRNAADCYVRAEEDRKAADAYLDAQEYDLAVRRYRTVSLSDKTLETPRGHSENISSETPQHEPPLAGEHEFTGEEILAAEKIQAAYRTYRKHHAAQTCAIGKGSKAQRNTIFIACLRNVYVANWGRTPYRTLYLWALPHLVVCLDKAIFIANELKRKAIRLLLLKGDHKHLEELGKRAGSTNALLKEGHLLRKTIEPNAAMHQARDEGAMKKAVLDVKDFIHRLPSPSLAQEIQEDFHIAYKLVMVEKQPVFKPEKPTLKQKI
ncbi:P-loop containing nucleoside triphosphate hydrolase protein [Boletus coccyginus]|nr:P-loop containing nucleoside triphosphate hydrolase protein [Boletus coccyginus]